LDEVLFDVRRDPLSQENWKDFLEKEHAEEVSKREKFGKTKLLMKN